MKISKAIPINKRGIHMIDIEVIDVPSNDAHLSLLIETLDKYLFELYPSDEVFLVDFEDPYIHEIEFVVAYSQGLPLGCGAIKKMDENTVELKRFFVHEQYRNRGIAGLILKHLEEKAIGKNFGVLRLETGDQQVEATGFYKKNGYYEIERYGEYAECSSSRCFEKKLCN